LGSDETVHGCAWAPASRASQAQDSILSAERLIPGREQRLDEASVSFRSRSLRSFLRLAAAGFVDVEVFVVLSQSDSAPTD
jgi:hypothetical protein